MKNPDLLGFKKNQLETSDINLDLSKLKTIQFTPNKIQIVLDKWSIRSMKNNINRIYILAERENDFLIITMSIPNDQIIIDLKIIDLSEDSSHSGKFKIKRRQNKL